MGGVPIKPNKDMISQTGENDLFLVPQVSIACFREAVLELIKYELSSRVVARGRLMPPTTEVKVQ